MTKPVNASDYNILFFFMFENDCRRLINSRIHLRWVKVVNGIVYFGLETVLCFTQASHKNACQPNFDHFICLPLHSLGEVLVTVEFSIPE